MKAIILTAGRAERLKPVINSGEKILLPFLGQPVGIKIVLQCISLGIKDFVIVVSSENKNIIEETFLSFFSNSDISFVFVTQKEPHGPGHAIKMCANYINEPVIIQLSDTVCTLKKITEGNWIGVSKIDRDYNQWCMVSVDESEKVIGLEDKPKTIPVTNFAAIGLYCFEDYNTLYEILVGDTNVLELSDIFYEFMKKSSIKIVEFNEWYDLGSMKNYIKNVRYKTADSRCFNNIVLSEYGTCIKKSTHLKTISYEKEWYKGIEEIPEIKKITPQIFNYFENGYEMEYFDYPSLAYLFLYSNVIENNWTWILEQLLYIVKNSLWKYSAPSEIVDRSYQLAKCVYGEKLKKRLNMWENECLNYNIIIINGKKYNGLAFYQRQIENRIEHLSMTASNYMSIIHGDLVFSNVLYSTKCGFFKLIDARGNFGERTIYGDNRYDCAKLRQCYHGLYDLIISDSFSLSLNKVERQKTPVFMRLPNKYV